MTLQQSLEFLEQALTEAMVEELQANGSYDTGDLAKSITYDIRTQGTTYQLVRSMLTYGIFVDQGDGRKGGKMPPVRPLIEWIKEKGIKVPGNLTVESFAFAIAKKIEKKGTNPRPRPFIEPAINKVMREKAEQILSEGTATDVLNAINSKLQDVKVSV